MNTSPQHWLDLFKQVNKECEPDEVVAIDDEEFYAQQIHNLSGEQDFPTAQRVAKEMIVLAFAEATELH